MSDYLEDEVSARERTRIMRHLSRCERCRALLESLTRALEQLRSLGDMEQVSPTPATVRAVLDRIERERR